MQEKFLRFPEVEDITGKSRPTIYRDIEAGTFPKPIKIGPRAVAWPSSVIQKWIDDRIKAAA